MDWPRRILEVGTLLKDTLVFGLLIPSAERTRRCAGRRKPESILSASGLEVEERRKLQEGKDRGRRTKFKRPGRGSVKLITLNKNFSEALMTGAGLLAEFLSSYECLTHISQLEATTMTISELKRLPTSKVRRIAQSLNLIIDLPGLTKGEMVGMISDRLGEGKVGWTLLDQFN